MRGDDSGAATVKRNEIGEENALPGSLVSRL